MAESGKPPYDVGYAKPPSKTRFTPGQSGNPSGRPRSAQNFVTAIEDELRARVTVTENGRRKRVTKREVIAKRLVNRAAEGDLRAIPLLLNEARGLENLPAGGIAIGVFGSSQEQAVIDGIVQRIRCADHPTSEPEPIRDLMNGPDGDEVDVPK
jgi:hypothetical protein